MNRQDWNDAAIISAAAAVLAWIYPPFVCFIGVGGVCAAAFGGIALWQLRETPARGLALARFGWFVGWFDIAVYVYRMSSLILRSVYG
ncbi:DUF4190 domain-containing protein [Kingella sp. SNUBH-2017]|jgi:hypothetical protein|uniref:DUF4190 domain-containing protein n=1 Tax=Kingella sp. SNUBH-2017 TaxID=2994077 RepID=UPI0023646727|nr:DUF4190 domain-containing protein [Kingella sp. SNUBH-2017]MDD2182316.1 DUF4190 domain-containing protein [Kingella sp. SNUBH-2017]